MNKVYDMAEKITKALSDKVNEVGNDKTIDNDTKYAIMQTYADIINLISDIVREQIGE